MEQWQQGMALEHAEAAAVSVVPLALSARLFDAEHDYPLAAHWWRQHGWAVVPVTALPSIGITVLIGDTPACVAFMYRDGGWGCIAWVVGDADLPKDVRGKAVDFGVEKLMQLGDELGLTWLYSVTPNPSMQERYTRLGWIDGKDTFRQYIRVHPALAAQKEQ